MKVLHVVASQQRRGAELFARDLVSQLSLVGVDQRVVALRGPIAIPAVPGTPVTVLDRGRVRVPFLRMGIAPILHLRKLVGEWEPDLIQAHGGEALKNATLAAFGRSTPVVYRRIGETPPWARRGPRRRVYSSMFRRAAMVIAVANSVREEMISLFHVAPTKVEVVPNAVDWSRVQPTKSRVEARDFMNLPQSGPLISSVGALIWEKDPLTHLEIVARVKQNHPDLVYVIAGDGPLREEMESYVRERDLVRSVIFLGSIASVSDLLSASDLLLFASRSEGMPASVIEAGMAGIPVVAFAVGGIPEVVVDQETGLLSEPGEIADIVESVSGLLSNEAAKRRLGNAAKQRCLEQFEISKVAPRYLQLYERLIA